MTIDELKTEGATVARALKSAAGPLPSNLRQRFIAVRSELFQRGIYDPVLVRFDSATVTKASTVEIAEQLATVIASLS